VLRNALTTAGRPWRPAFATGDAKPVRPHAADQAGLMTPAAVVRHVAPRPFLQKTLAARRSAWEQTNEPGNKRTLQGTDEHPREWNSADASVAMCGGRATGAVVARAGGAALAVTRSAATTPAEASVRAGGLGLPVKPDAA